MPEWILVWKVHYYPYIYIMASTEKTNEFGMETITYSINFKAAYDNISRKYPLHGNERTKDTNK